MMLSERSHTHINVHTLWSRLYTIPEYTIYCDRKYTVDYLVLWWQRGTRKITKGYEESLGDVCIWCVCMYTYNAKIYQVVFETWTFISYHFTLIKLKKLIHFLNCFIRKNTIHLPVCVQNLVVFKQIPLWFSDFS